MPSTSPLARVTLVAVLRPTQSGSEAFLALASDGKHYWVKAPDNPQGSRTLVAEVIAYGIGHLIGAPLPQNVLVDIPPGFRRSYADGRRMRPGRAHGSQDIPNVIVSDTWATYSGLDDNRVRQAAIYALWDLCMGVDPQWLHETTHDFSMWTFDHGLWLASDTDWDIASLRKIGTSEWAGEIGADVASSRALYAVADKVVGLTLDEITCVADSVPLEWGTTAHELSELAALLHARSIEVAARLRAAAYNARHP